MTILEEIQQKLMEKSSIDVPEETPARKLKRIPDEILGKNTNERSHEESPGNPEGIPGGISEKSQQNYYYYYMKRTSGLFPKETPVEISEGTPREISGARNFFFENF